MATAVDEVEVVTADQVYIEPLAPPQPKPSRPIPIVQRLRRNWTKPAFIAGAVIALAIGVELWRLHSANAISYDTVPWSEGRSRPVSRPRARLTPSWTFKWAASLGQHQGTLR